MSAIAVPYEAPAAELVEALPVASPLPLGAVPHLFVVPAFNEEENLPRLLADLESRPELFPPDSRVIVVDDGSTDGTAAVVSEYAGPLTVELVRLERNQGPGAAFRAGFSAALADSSEDALVVTLEADTTSDLARLPAMLGRAAGGAELVLASVHDGGQFVNASRFRTILSAGAGFTVRHALGIDAKTVSSFFRVYRASILRQADRRYGDDLIRERGFVCMAEVLTKLSALGARVEEVPVDVDVGRRVGKSNMRILPTMLGYWRLIARQWFGQDSVPA